MKDASRLAKGFALSEKAQRRRRLYRRHLKGSFCFGLTEVVVFVCVCIQESTGISEQKRKDYSNKSSRDGVDRPTNEDFLITLSDDGRIVCLAWFTLTLFETGPNVLLSNHTVQQVRLATEKFLDLELNALYASSGFPFEGVDLKVIEWEVARRKPTRRLDESGEKRVSDGEHISESPQRRSIIDYNHFHRTSQTTSDQFVSHRTHRRKLQLEFGNAITFQANITFQILPPPQSKVQKDVDEVLQSFSYLLKNITSISDDDLAQVSSLKIADYASASPSLAPSSQPSLEPSFNPTSHPSLAPATIPSLTPTHSPIYQPTSSPTKGSTSVSSVGVGDTPFEATRDGENTVVILGMSITLGAIISAIVLLLFARCHTTRRKRRSATTEKLHVFDDVVSDLATTPQKSMPQATPGDVPDSRGGSTNHWSDSSSSHSSAADAFQFQSALPEISLDSETAEFVRATGISLMVGTASESKSNSSPELSLPPSSQATENEDSLANIDFALPAGHDISSTDNGIEVVDKNDSLLSTSFGWFFRTKPQQTKKSIDELNADAPASFDASLGWESSSGDQDRVLQTVGNPAPTPNTNSENAFSFEHLDQRIHRPKPARNNMPRPILKGSSLRKLSVAEFEEKWEDLPYDWDPVKDNPGGVLVSGGAVAAARSSPKGLNSLTNNNNQVDKNLSSSGSSRPMESSTDTSNIIHSSLETSQAQSSIDTSGLLSGIHDGSFPTADASRSIIQGHAPSLDSAGLSIPRNPSFRSVGDNSSSYQTAIADSQAESSTMHPLDWSNRGSEVDEMSGGESTLSDSGAPNHPISNARIVWANAYLDAGGQRIGAGRIVSGVSPQSRETSYFTEAISPDTRPSGPSGTTETNSGSVATGASNTTKSSQSESKQLINDLVWLEKKIADVKSSAGLDPLNTDILADSMSFDSDMISPSSNEEGYDRTKSPIMPSIVCRDCFAPPGRLHIVIHSTKDGPSVHSVKSGSALEGHLFPGDLIIAVDNIDTRSYSAEQVMKMMTDKSAFERKITVLRFEDHD